MYKRQVLRGLKPLFAELFDGLFADRATYSHWAWADIDLVFGCLRGALPARELDARTVVTFRPTVDALGRLFAHVSNTAGQLTVVRNDALGRTLWRRVTATARHALDGGGYTSFDEKGFGTGLRHVRAGVSVLSLNWQFKIANAWAEFAEWDYFWERGELKRARVCARA